MINFRKPTLEDKQWIKQRTAEMGCPSCEYTFGNIFSYIAKMDIEVAEISDCKIKYFDRKGDADFAPRLSAWLMDKTGKQWQLERAVESVHTHTITEQKQEELAADPMIASAMSLFENAEIVGVK